MDPVAFECKVNVGPVQQAMKALGKKTGDLTNVFRGPIDSSVTQFFEAQFATEGRRGGEAWPKLRPLTLKLRTRPGHGRGGILYDLGTMRGSFVKAAGPGALRVITATTYERGSRLPTAGYHQKPFAQHLVFGKLMHFPRTRPARPVVPTHMPAELVTAWTKLVSKHLEASP